MKIPNIQKWNHYKSIIDIKAKEYINAIIDFDNLNKVFYKIDGNGILDKCLIKDVTYPFKLTFYKKPNNNDIDKIKEYSENVEFDINKIIFEFIITNSDYKIKGYIKYINYNTDNKDIFFTEEEAKAHQENLNNIKKERLKFFEENKKDKDYNYIANGYKFLGWLNGGEVSKNDEYIKCREEKHEVIEVSMNNRGSENIVSCPKCKIYWKYDCSD